MAYGKNSKYGKRKSYSKRKPRSSTPKRRSSSKSSAKKGFKDKVLRIVNGVAETKMGSHILADAVKILGTGLQPGHGFEMGAILPLTPIRQGVSQDERIGNKIQNVSLTLFGVIDGQPLNTSTNNNFQTFEIHVLVARQKNAPVCDPSHIVAQDTTLTTGQDGPIDGSVFNTLLPFNTSMYQIYAHRCYKFNAENAVNTPGGSIHSTGNVTYKRFKISVPVPRIWAFADANVSLGVPQNVGVGVFAYCVNSDSISLGVDQCRARITLAATIKWKDY